MIAKTRIGKGKKVADRLRDELSRFSGGEGTPVASASEIAREYHISLPTAHSAINQLVKEGLLYRVQGSGTFLKSGSGKQCIRIGIADSTLSPLSAEVQKILDMHIDYAMKFFMERNCETTLIAYPDLVKEPSNLSRNFDALLVSINYMDSNSIRILSESGLPVVVYRFENEANLPFSQVYYDQNSGIAKAVAAIMPSLSDSPIVICEKTPSGNASKEMFRKYLVKAGFSDSRIEYHEVVTFSREISCYRLVRVHYKEFRNRVIFCANDDIAFNLMNAFFDEDMHPGVDYRICGIGNYEDQVNLFGEKPILASVERSKKLMAEESCRLLQYLMENPTESRFSVKVPTDFIMRQSGKQLMKGGL